ncbi:MAG: hypothetical protein ACRD96_09415 [Bryobacteraceae bacterium]
MSFSDSLESNLKNLEAREERDPGAGRRDRARKQSEKARVLAAAPWAEKLRNGKFTAGLLRDAARISHGMRTKVRILWIDRTLRLEAREHRLDLVPTPEGVVAQTSVSGSETAREMVDLAGDPELFARKWLDKVGPPPPPPKIDYEEE